MRCEQMEDIIFSGRKPDAREREAMREHAEVCEACRVLMEQEEWLRAAREMDEDVRLPESFTRGWRRAVRSAPQKRGAGRWLERLPLRRAAAYAACAVVLLGIGSQIGRLRPENSLTAAYDAAPQSYKSTGASGMMLSRSMDAGANDTAAGGEKILRSAQLTLEADDLDGVVAGVRERTEAAGGRVTFCDVYTTDDARRADMELSIPDSALDAFLGGTQELGKVTRSQSSETDVTASYRDNASRLESARAQKQRLDELYAQAQDMEDIVAVTNALFEVQQQIDQLEGANRSIDERAANARVSLSIEERAQAEREGIPFLTRLGDQARQGMRQLGEFLSGTVLALAWLLPWAALAVALLGIIWVAARWIRRRKM